MEENKSEEKNNNREESGWNRVKITTKKGYVFEVVSDKLKPGEYEFGIVSDIRQMTQEEVEEYIDLSIKLFELWVSTIPNPVFENLEIKLFGLAGKND